MCCFLLPFGGFCLWSFCALWLSALLCFGSLSRNRCWKEMRICIMTTAYTEKKNCLKKKGKGLGGLLCWSSEKDLS